MYDFDTLIDRTGTGAVKWDRRTQAERDAGIVAMSVADMELPVAPCVRDAVVAAAQLGIYGYTDPTPRFYDAVRGWLSARHNLEVTANQIVPVTGIVPSLSVAVRAFTVPSGGVIVQSPVYYPFFSMIERNGRRVENCPLRLTDNGYEMDYDALERAAQKDDVTLMILCSPHNPVGRVWTRAELTRVDDILRANGVTLIADEIHGDLIFEGRHVSFPTLHDAARANTVLLMAPSKTFNVPGLSTAFAVIPADGLRERFRRQLDADGAGNINYFGHAAAIAAYEGGADWLSAVIEYIRGNYALLKSTLAECAPQATVFPMQGTYLAWVDFRYLGLTDEALETLMRRDAGLILDEGYIFGQGGSGFERFNLALPRPELQKALDRFREALKRHLA